MTDKTRPFNETDETRDPAGYDETEKVDQFAAGPQEPSEFGAAIDSGIDTQSPSGLEIVNAPEVFTRNGRYPRPSIIL